MVMIRFVLLHGWRQPCANNAPTPEPRALLYQFSSLIDTCGDMRRRGFRTLYGRLGGFPGDQTWSLGICQERCLFEQFVVKLVRILCMSLPVLVVIPSTSSNFVKLTRLLEGRVVLDSLMSELRPVRERGIPEMA
jgi:hypothetical protein